MYTTGSCTRSGRFLGDTDKIRHGNVYKYNKPCKKTPNSKTKNNNNNNNLQGIKMYQLKNKLLLIIFVLHVQTYTQSRWWACDKSSRTVLFACFTNILYKFYFFIVNFPAVQDEVFCAKKKKKNV